MLEPSSQLKQSTAACYQTATFLRTLPNLFFDSFEFDYHCQPELAIPLQKKQPHTQRLVKDTFHVIVLSIAKLDNLVW